MYNRKVCKGCQDCEEFLINLIKDFGDKVYCQVVIKRIKKFLGVSNVTDKTDSRIISKNR